MNHVNLFYIAFLLIGSNIIQLIIKKPLGQIPRGFRNITIKQRTERNLHISIIVLLSIDKILVISPHVIFVPESSFSKHRNNSIKSLK